VSLWLAQERGLAVSHEWIYRYVLSDKCRGDTTCAHRKSFRASSVAGTHVLGAQPPITAQAVDAEQQKLQDRLFTPFDDPGRMGTTFAFSPFGHSRREISLFSNHRPA
jgi:hypothetical protein